MEVETDGGFELIVYDLFGLEVYRGEASSVDGQIAAEIDAQGFSSGTYMLTIIAKDGSFRKSHIMIKR